ncbi:MAG: phosphoribosylglycinamide formyltransferase [Gammaproteobacteria bacterium]|jgi:phosphoribosylglycinamide formyltransferase-1
MEAVSRPERGGVVVLLSGEGSNLAALLDALEPATVRAVISDRAEAGGLARAADRGLPAIPVVPRDHADRAAWEAVLQETIERFNPSLVVLAGFMRILSRTFTGRFAGRMLNIHPSLLPRYRGLDTHRRVLQAGDRLHGTSVHFVTEELDGGPVILQAEIPVLENDTETSLDQRIKSVEHRVYPQVVRWFLNNRLRLDDGRVILDDRVLDKPVVVPWGDE